MRSQYLAFLAIVVLGCGSDSAMPDAPAEPVLLPADYAQTYQQVRNCRFSLEHDLIRIRVLASPDALTPYNGRTAPFPVGAVIVKEQYAEDDTNCAGPIVDYTVMKKLDAADTTAENMGWSWQEVSATFRSTDADIKRCTNCHKDCGNPPDGYDATCAVP
ncbi:MAG: hypothetical protein JWP01_1818 [Myxococcales bacterium]|nr:hypothetical protein [Myxococcales bacterium]